MQNVKIKRSKAALKQALLRLMKYKKLSRITIKELCEEARLNRSTFYANYSDIYELIQDIHTDIFDKMYENLKEEPDDFQENVWKSRTEAVTRIILYIQDNLDIFQLLLTNNDDNLFEKHLTAYYMNQYTLSDEIRSPKDNRYGMPFGYKIQDKTWEACYLFLYHAIGSFTLVHQWVTDKCPCTAQELAELICAQSQHVLRQ